MRVGLTSFTRMLSDTSIASMIVELDHGSVTRAVGRARANSKTDSANQKSAGGTSRHWRLEAWRARLTLLTRSAGLPGRRSSHRYSAGSKGSASINHRFWGQRKFIYDGRRITAAPLLARAIEASAGTTIEHRFWRKPSATSRASAPLLGPSEPGRSVSSAAMTEQQQLEAAIAALEGQRSTLGDAVVESLLVGRDGQARGADPSRLHRRPCPHRRSGRSASCSSTWSARPRSLSTSTPRRSAP